MWKSTIPTKQRQLVWNNIGTLSFSDWPGSPLTPAGPGIPSRPAWPFSPGNPDCPGRPGSPGLPGAPVRPGAPGPPSRPLGPGIPGEPDRWQHKEMLRNVKSFPLKSMNINTLYSHHFMTASNNIVCLVKPSLSLNVNNNLVTDNMLWM